MQQPQKNVSAQKNKSAREIAVETVYQILEKKAFSNLQLEKNLQSYSLKTEDRNLVTEIVNGTVRMWLRLDWTLDHFLKKKMEKLNPWLRNILRISAYQILCMERIPDHAVVSEAVRLTRKKVSEGLTGLCNGVLRSLLRQKDQIEIWLENIQNPVQQASIRYSLPEKMVQQLWKDISSAERESVLRFFNMPAKVQLRTNGLQITPQKLVDILAKEKIQARILEQLPGALEIVEAKVPLVFQNSFREGKFYIQNSASQLAAWIVDPQPHELILDLCCGVGGKSTHLAEKSQDQATIVAVERYAHKLQLLLENCERLGLHSIQPLCADITRGLEMYTAKADRVLLDAPCSGWGVLNRRADIRWGQDEASLQELQSLQAALLKQAAFLVKPGGLLFYVTCTLRPEENEQNIRAFLQEHPDFHLEGFQEALTSFPLSEQDQQHARAGMLCILPGKYGTDGMFYAKLRKGGISCD